jgi:hypothetical protein
MAKKGDNQELSVNHNRWEVITSRLLKLGWKKKIFRKKFAMVSSNL